MMSLKATGLQRGNSADPIGHTWSNILLFTLYMPKDWDQRAQIERVTKHTLIKRSRKA